MKKTEKKEKRNILLMALKKHKISLIFVLFFSFASVSFAWFIYNKTVDMAMSAHVKSWKVFLGDDEQGDTYVIELSDLYPGMTTINGDQIPITNDGEMAANVSVQIKSLTLFGVLQNPGAPGANCDATVDRNDPDYLCDYTIQSTTGAGGSTTFTIKGYPFELQFILGITELGAGGMSSLNYSLEWPYESSLCTGNDTSCDEKDTWYGEKSYEYNVAYRTQYRIDHPDFTGNDSDIKVPSIEIVMTLNFSEVSP